MRILVRGDRLEVTPALREYAERKIGRLEKYFDATNVEEVHVTLSVTNGGHNVEVTLPLAGNIVIRGEERTGDMYASIDLVSEKLEKQIDKYKTRISRRIKNGAFKFMLKEGTGPARETGVAIQETDDEFGRLVRTKRFAFKPMPVDEAIMQMDLLGHDFFVFSNAETEEVNVVYKRRDGNYGLIEPTF